MGCTLCLGKAKGKKTKEKRGQRVHTRSTGWQVCFRYIFHIYIASLFFTLLFAGLCWVLFFSFLFFVRLGLIGFAGVGGRFEFAVFICYQGVFCLRHMRGRWGPGTGFRGLMIFHLGCKPIKGFLMLPGYWDRVCLVLLLLLSS